MKIAITLNAHENTEVVSDCIHAIQKYVTNDIAVIIDGAHWENWGKDADLPAHKIHGFVHNYPKAPYRNLAYGLLETYQLFPDADWYCYSEYDVLFVSDGFKTDLEEAEKENVWCVGNDLRDYCFNLPYFEKIIGKEISEYKYLLGCCVFYHSKLIKKMVQENFFNKFLEATNEFEKGFFPGYEEQYGYDFGETLFPTMAHYYGGKVAQFANWNQDFNHWTGNFKKYPMRWKPALDWEDNFYENSILHPIKADSELRVFHQEKRNRNA